MALREIRVQGDPILGKVCKPVAAVSERILELIDDMLDTMYEIPSDESVEKVIIDGDVVKGEKPKIVKKKIA